MLNLNNSVVYDNPYSYSVLSNFIDEDVFSGLQNTFDEIDEKYWNAYDSSIKRVDMIDRNSPFYLQEHGEWSNLYRSLDNQNTFSRITSMFSSSLSEIPSIFSPDMTYEENFKLFMAISRAEDGYNQAPHVDFPDKFIAFVLFFNDKDWAGGDFLVHETRESTAIHTVEAKKNTAVCFLSSPDSIHSVSLQQNTNSPRDFLYAAYTTKDGRPSFL